MYCDIPELGRCCFCMPLRRGVLVFGYLNIVFSMFMLGLYCYCVHVGLDSPHLIYHGSVSSVAAEACLTVFTVEILFNAVLVYGTHRRNIICVKTFFYFAVGSTVASVLLQILEATQLLYYLAFETTALMFAGLCIQLYLIILVRSLIKKLEVEGPHLYENQLHQIVTGEQKITPSGVYDNTKRMKILRVYYYYGIATTMSAAVIYIVITIREDHSNVNIYLMAVAFIFCGIVIEVYLLLLIRSELNKISEGGVSYVNHLAEVLIQPTTVISVQPSTGSAIQPAAGATLNHMSPGTIKC